MKTLALLCRFTSFLDDLNPLRVCFQCGRKYWGGLPFPWFTSEIVWHGDRATKVRRFGWQWLPGWSDYCQHECSEAANNEAFGHADRCGCRSCLPVPEPRNPYRNAPLSTCCGEPPLGGMLEHGICSYCREHAEFETLIDE